ncbi:MAG: histidine phosphatase family protein [Candidatus Nomurabacteria bacterium]
MKEIYIIRHAESISNAGEKTDNHDTIPLSEKGRTQSMELAEKLNIVPELIIVSPYSRTRETAEPFIAKHSSVPIETWDVQEFTFLDPKNYNGTTGEQRFEAAKKYWIEASIHHKEAEDVESFSEMTKRMSKLMSDLKERPEKTITIFSHGRFIHGLKLYMEKVKKLGRYDLNDEELNELKEIHKEGVLGVIEGGRKFPIENASVHRIEI